MSPGALVHVGDRLADVVRLWILDYDGTLLEEKDPASLEECFAIHRPETVTWIHMSGLHQPGVVEALGKHFNIHPLVLEDILNADHRPKIEDYEECLFLVIKNVSRQPDSREIDVEQISVVVGDNFVISFQESDRDIFEPVKKRIRNRMGRIRRRGADYLAYTLVDTVIDGYFHVLEDVEETIEAIEDTLISETDGDTLEAIHRLKREILFLRKNILPLWDITNRLEKEDTPFIDESTRIYIRDLNDHMTQIRETVEIFREMTTGLLDLYHSGVSNRMNEVMKVLTIISTIFIPLGFIAGIYGMNFKYMPELELKWGYAAVWCLILVVGVSMLVLFKRRKWF